MIGDDQSPVALPMDYSEPASQILPVESSEESKAPEPDLRALLRDQFEQWLDENLMDEAPPSGVSPEVLAAVASTGNGQPADPQADLYSLFSALTNLTGEIRLQGRAFKQLTDTLAPVAQTPELLKEMHAAQVESATEIQDALAAQSFNEDDLPVSSRQICDTLIDLYDRLARGLQTCDDGVAAMRGGAGQSWLSRRLGSNAVERAALSAQAIRDASAMTLARLVAAMQDWGIQRIGRAGEQFDSARMSAVDVQQNSEVDPGTVLLVNRSGYSLNGNLVTTAQVTVSKAGS